jgi:hypothetical protein
MKEKTKSSYFFEWIKFFIIFSLIIIFGFYILKKNYQSNAIGFVLIAILFLAAIVLGIQLILRSIGILMIIFFPEKKGKSILITYESIKINLENNKTDIYPCKEINRIVLTEGTNGIFINSVNGKESYSLPNSYTDLERQIDKINSPKIFTKEKQLIETNEKMDPNKDLTNTKNTVKVGSKHNSDEEIIKSENGRMVIYYENISKIKDIKKII